MMDEKALEEYTVAQLKEIARDTGKITGVTSMKKADLISAIRALQDEGGEKAEDVSSEAAEKVPEKKASKEPEKSMGTGSSLKEKMAALRQKQEELRKKGDKMGVARLRRRISRLKKRTRMLARAAS